MTRDPMKEGPKPRRQELTPKSNDPKANPTADFAPADQGGIGLGFLKQIQEMLKGTTAGKVFPWAILVTGIAGAAAVALQFFSNPVVAVFATVIMLILMAVAKVSYTFAKSAGKPVYVLGVMFGYSAMILSVVIATLLTTGFFFGWPRALAQEPVPNWNENVSVEIRIDGVEKPLRTAEIPISTPVTVTLLGLPTSARVISWSEPNSGRIFNGHSMSVDFQGDNEGPIEFWAIVQQGAAKSEIPIRLRVRRPFPED